MAQPLSFMIKADSASARAELQRAINAVYGFGNATLTVNEGAVKAWRETQAAVTAAAGATAAATRRVQSEADNAMRQGNAVTGNLVAQFNDIGMMLAAGQNPLMLAIQQGGQVSQSLGPLGAAGAAKALGAAFMGMLSPVSLLTFAVIAGGAALVQWGMAAFSAGEEAQTVEERVKGLTEAVDAYSRAAQAASQPNLSIAEQFGAATAEARALLNIQREIAQVEAERQAVNAARGVAEAFGAQTAADLSNPVPVERALALSDLGTTLGLGDAVAAEYDAATQRAMDFSDALAALGGIRGPEELSAAVAKLRADFQRDFGAAIEQSATFKAALDALATAKGPEAVAAAAARVQEEMGRIAAPADSAIGKVEAVAAAIVALSEAKTPEAQAEAFERLRTGIVNATGGVSQMSEETAKLFDSLTKTELARLKLSAVPAPAANGQAAENQAAADEKLLAEYAKNTARLAELAEERKRAVAGLNAAIASGNDDAAQQWLEVLDGIDAATAKAEDQAGTALDRAKALKAEVDRMRRAADQLPDTAAGNSARAAIGMMEQALDAALAKGKDLDGMTLAGLIQQFELVKGAIIDVSGLFDGLNAAADRAEARLSRGIQAYGEFRRNENAQIDDAANKGIFDLIKSRESGGNYNATLDNGAYTGGDVNLINMTLREVLALQRQMLANPNNTKNSSAVGAYQIVGTTLGGRNRDGSGGLIAEMGLSLDDVFTPELQDRMAAQLVRRRMGQGAAGLRAEWEGLNGVSDAQINTALGRQSIPTQAEIAPDALGVQRSDQLARLQEQGRQALAAMGNAVAGINEKVQAGLLTTEQGVDGVRSAKERAANALADLIPQIEAVGGPGAAQAVGNLRAAFRELSGEVVRASSEMRDKLSEGISQPFENLLVDAAKGKDAFAAFTNSVLSNIARIVSQRFTQSFITPVINSLLSGFGFADGGVPALEAFAMGGLPGLPDYRNAIVDQPTLFAMGGDKTGLMGEAGLEAIVPLVKGADGLGVRATGADGRETVLPLQRASGGALGVKLPEWAQAFAMGGVPNVALPVWQPPSAPRAGLQTARYDGAQPGQAVGGAAEVKVEMNITNNAPGVEVQQTGARVSGGVAIVDMLISQAKGAMVEDVTRGGDFADAMAGVYGLKRQGR